MEKKYNLMSQYRNEYITENIKFGLLPKDSFYDMKILSTNASYNIDDPIYFWQLYSVIGEPGIEIIITKFYNLIFNDDNNEWFKKEFVESGSIKYHIERQKIFWISVMGGDKKYIGGDTKLNLKHKLVNNIMTTEGAELWMYYMTKTLNELKILFSYDKRIMKSINDFLIFFIIKYSNKFNFNVTNILIKSKL